MRGINLSFWEMEKWPSSRVLVNLKELDNGEKLINNRKTN